MKSKEELKRLAYENACCRCQYYENKKCNNKDTCVWKQIISDLEEYESIVDCLADYNLDITRLREICIFYLMKKDYLKKLEKAIEIIKPHLYFHKLTEKISFIDYVIDAKDNKENYDLLKEVFGND